VNRAPVRTKEHIGSPPLSPRKQKVDREREVNGVEEGAKRGGGGRRSGQRRRSSCSGVRLQGRIWPEWREELAGSEQGREQRRFFFEICTPSVLVLPPF
jgi:hypothetical protein